MAQRVELDHRIGVVPGVERGDLDVESGVVGDHLVDSLPHEVAVVATLVDDEGQDRMIVRDVHVGSPSLALDRQQSR
jgi:hypothetical protein